MRVFDEPEASFTQRHDTAQGPAARGWGDVAALPSHATTMPSPWLRLGAGPHPSEGAPRPWPLGHARLTNQGRPRRRFPGGRTVRGRVHAPHPALRARQCPRQPAQPRPQSATNLGDGAAHVASKLRTLLGHVTVLGEASTPRQRTNKFAAAADSAFHTKPPPACGATPPPAP
jgi:hypothetical protein